MTGVQDKETATIAKTPERPVQEDDPANAAPKFDDDNDPNTPGKQPDAVRSVKENEKDESVGDPVVADDEDLLEYSISDTDNFKVDNGGQITTKVELDYETKSQYTIVLTAEDPSGATGSTNVIINVTDENDPAVISGDKTYSYAENGTDAVATFTATDQDGDAIEWSLEGVDKGVFEIDEDTGELTFKDSPNFEGAKDKDEVAETEALGDQGAGDNKYQVTVKASGGKLDVEVEVTDVDEAGSVSFDNPQPQVTRPLKASFKDDDGKTKPSWQWSRGSSAEGPWTDIAGATTASRTPDDADIGNYLRAVVSYTDRHGSQTAEGVTEYAVEGETLANAAPKFTDEDADTTGIQVSREVNENVKGAVGKPIEVTDADNDVLLYTITGGVDKDCFGIGKTSAQLSLTAKRDFETTGTACKTGGDDRETGQTGRTISDNLNKYEVKVTATDPSGAATEQLVIVTLKDVNEEPVFVKASTDTTQDPDVALNQKTLYIDENDDSPALRQAEAAGTWSITYDANDSDGSKDAATTYKVEGADAKYFKISSSDGTGTLESVNAEDVTADTTGTLKVLTANYEKKSTYSITIVAKTIGAGGDGNKTTEERYGRLAVTVKVVDKEDAGKVTLDAREPQEGKSVTATLSDEDGGITGLTWQWWRAPAYAADNTNKPDDADGNPDAVKKCSLISTAVTPIPGTTTAVAWTKIDKATAPVYTPSSYTFNHDGTATYDHDNDTNTDQIATPEVGYCLRAVATYTDNIDKDTDETAQKEPERAVQKDDPANTAPKFQDDNDPNTPGKQPDAKRSVKENAKGENVGEPVTADDVDLLMYFISDTDNFKVDNDGQISTAVELDYETKSEYTVVLTATDPSGATDTINVIITVTDEDDPPLITRNVAPEFDAETAERSVDERSPAGTNVGDPVTATDMNDDAVTYSLGGDDAASFAIDAETGQISVGEGTVLNYESDTTSYSVTVTATEVGGDELSDEIAVTISVNDVEESACVMDGAVADADHETGLDMDCQILLGAKDALIGDGTATLDWSSDTPITEWAGIAAGTGRVTGIYLPGGNTRLGGGVLSGTLPASLGGLDALTNLTLTDNDLGGEIPDLNGLDSIKVMVLGGNAFTGGIPASLGELDTLLRLWLHRNEGGFTDGIPAELGSLPKLRYLMLHGNGLTGEIPSELGNATNLKALYLYGNALTGSIPAELGNLVDADGASVRLLYLHNNDLSGDVPSELGNLVSLRALRLSGNMLTGCIPAAIFDKVVDAAAAGLSACAAAEDDGNGNGNGS